MAALNDEKAEQVIDDAVRQITESARSTIDELWEHWNQLGVDHNQRLTRVTQLLQMNNLNQMINETKNKLENIQEDINKLKEEAKELSRTLGVEVELDELKPGMPLVKYRKILEEQIAGSRKKAAQRRGDMEGSLPK